MGEPAAPMLVGRYAIYGKIASGGMATVHFGRLLGAAGFSRTVAIKRLHPHLAEAPEFLSTMIDEARLAARIHHPNVVPTLDVVAVNGELLIVMEYVRGEALSRLLRAETTRKRPLPLPVVSAIAIGALHGLHAAHEATSDRGAPLGIVHRDVSPQNVLVGVDGVARVIDFGVAKAAGRLQTTSEGAIKGKLAYMAPEQVAAGDKRLASGDVTRAADVYAMGAVLWEMLTGERLFTGEGDAQLMFKVLAGAKLPPSRFASGVPPQLDGIVMRALALDATKRFATAEQMAEALFRAVPPAFPTEVSKWVDDVAHDSLVRRGSELAEIESLSDRVTVPSEPNAAVASVASGASGASGAPVSTRGRTPSWGGEPTTGGSTIHEAPTVVSQPSSMSLETSRRPGLPAPRRTRTVLASVLMAVVLVAAVGATVAWRGARTAEQVGASSAPSRSGSSSSAAMPTAAATPVTTTRTDAPTPPASSEPVVAPDAAPVAPSAAPTASASAAKPSPAPPRARPKDHAPPKATTPFKFTQPD